MTTCATIQIDQLNRVRIDYDDAPECPVTWFGGRVLDLRDGRAVAGDCDDLEDVRDAVRLYAPYDPRDEYGVSHIARHCARRGEAVRIVYESCGRGAYLVACDEWAIDDAARLFGAWMDGEAYAYALEVMDRAVTASGDVVETWHEAAYSGGHYEGDTWRTLEADAVEWATVDAWGLVPVRYELEGREVLQFSTREDLDFYVRNAKCVADDLREGRAIVRKACR